MQLSRRSPALYAMENLFIILRATLLLSVGRRHSTSNKSHSPPFGKMASQDPQPPTATHLPHTSAPFLSGGRGKRHVLLEQFYASLFEVASFDWPSSFRPFFPIFLILRNEKLLAWKSDYDAGEKLYVSGYLSAATCYRNVHFTRFSLANQKGDPRSSSSYWPPVWRVHSLKGAKSLPLIFSSAD